MASLHWTRDGVPSQSGKVIVITGATNGLGLEIAKALAAKGGSIVIAARNQQKGPVSWCRPALRPNERRCISTTFSCISTTG